MKKPSKLVCTTLAAVTGISLLCGVAFAASTITTKTIEANYMGIRLVVDGVQVTPTDATGNVVDPFVSEGTTYLPVRAVANALGKEVTWEGESKTVYIGAIPGQEESWMKKLPPYQVGTRCKIYDGSDPKSYFTVGGNNHTEGVYIERWATNSGYALWNTNCQYRSMTFKIGHVDGKEEESTSLEVYLDGELSHEYELAWDGPIQTITIPLNYAANVKLYLPTHDTFFGLFDISFSE